MSSNRNICSAARHRRAGRWASLALIILVAGCGRREVPPPRPQPIPSIRPVSRERPLPTTGYVATAASIDLYDIRAGEMAVQRSINAKVRDYAARLIEDHRGTSAQLSFAGRRLNLLPNAQLAPPHQAMIDALASAGNFDATFIRQQLDIHRAAQRMQAAYAARGDSPTLRPVAANAAAVEARHLAELGSL